MSEKATESMLSKVNRLIGVDESYKAPEKLLQEISDEQTAGELFFRFLPEFDYDLSYEWFNGYFEDEHADRRKNKQDFTPRSVSKLMSAMMGSGKQTGIVYEPAAGTGSTIISHWWGECSKCRYPWDYRPQDYLYVCEELSDKTVPFLLFNLMIRGMNAIVIHGNTLTRKAKDIYCCINGQDSLMCFSALHKLGHTKEAEEMFGVRFIETGEEEEMI